MGYAVSDPNEMMQRYGSDLVEDGIRADERRCLREGAREKILAILDEISCWPNPWKTDLADRILDAIFGGTP
jgi:hypothetical protein